MSLARQIVLNAIESDKVKDLVMEVLKRLVEHTDNEIDDALVEQLDLAIYTKSKIN
jgi:hypothetical protein|tara:strand:+ start:937 stop:1104 length:168 start_codon:yes stop_codon:yes gene_type:complete